ncbi:hypothetical protein Salat_1194600 [Sesamum alatum]|uniref:Uncharacterized protein n=1 Tax=Sesamum alatum TaxID=300844 RepID=A0AAE2CNR7_9LAMI|nr:hypothetical protein Salat_1194600 [Sesamum alatum]
MQSHSFEAAMVKRATNEGFVSFYKCLSQLKLLKALKDGFDPRTMSFFKDAELKDYPLEVVVDSVLEDEFASLFELTPPHPTSDVAASSVTPIGPPRLMAFFFLFPFCIPYPLQNSLSFSSDL